MHLIWFCTFSFWNCRLFYNWEVLNLGWISSTFSFIKGVKNKEEKKNVKGSRGRDLPWGVECCNSIIKLTVFLLQFQAGLPMAEEPRITEVPHKPTPTIVLPKLCMKNENNPQYPSSTPSTPVGLRKTASIKHDCLCSPTTHAGSFRCRYHRNNLPRSSRSVGSKLSELGSKPDALHA